MRKEQRVLRGRRRWLATKKMSAPALTLWMYRRASLASGSAQSRWASDLISASHSGKFERLGELVGGEPRMVAPWRTRSRSLWRRAGVMVGFELRASRR